MNNNIRKWFITALHFWDVLRCWRNQRRGERLLLKAMKLHIWENHPKNFDKCSDRICRQALSLYQAQVRDHYEW